MVKFPSFGSEGHGVQPPQGDSVFCYISVVHQFFLRRIFFFFHTFMDQLKSFVSYSHILHSKMGMRLSIKSTYYAPIGSFKFASNFTESPCSPVVTFPSFGSEGHGVQPPKGDFVFCYISFVLQLFLRRIFFFWRHFWTK